MTYIKVKGLLKMKKALSALMCVALMMTGVALIPASADGTNPPPAVIPAIRAWEGKQGRFYLKPGMKIIAESQGLITDGQREIISSYFSDIAGINIAFSSGIAKDGDIVLKATANSQIGDEGYILNIEDIITIEANTGRGFLYGIITLLQSHFADGYIPKGKATDWPAYPVRSGMIDVARAYIPLEYVEEITKYFAWFKLNEIHLHINDNGANDYNIFRLESDIPGLTATDGYYSKADYREYQKRMLEYGVEVITEIDTPAHSRCFADVVPDLMLSDKAHLDITKPETLEFIKKLFDEYITGEDPVFVSKKVHFGTDEYPEGFNEEMRAYTDALIKHINSRGYAPRFWGAFGGDKGFNGKTPVSSDAQANFWAESLSDYQTLFSMGYDIINSYNGRLYCVPGGNYGFPDYFDLKLLYSAWFVHYMGYGQGSAVSPTHPQLKGASFCLWNDRHTEWGGFSMFDIFDRVRYQVCLVSEKTWTGEQTKNISADDFLSRFEIQSRRAGNANPSRYAAFPLDGDDVNTVKSVGFPYLFSADITVSDYKDALILDGDDGELFITPQGKIAFKRETYTFNYNYIIPLETTVNIKLYADNKQTVLIVNDTFYYEPVNLKNPRLNESSTFVLPFEKAGSKNVKIENISINTPDFNLNDKKLNTNMALGKHVTVSGLEVDYALNEPLAVDGDRNTRLSFARDKDVQWMILDLGQIRDVNRIVIDFFERISDYEIYVSADGENYTKVYEISGREEGIRQTDEVKIDLVKARYIKYVQLKRWFCAPYNTYYSGGICEFEVYGMDTAKYLSIIDEAEKLIDKGEKAKVSEIKKALNALNNYLKAEVIYETHIDGLYNNLQKTMDDYNNPMEESSLESTESQTEETSAMDVKPPKKGSFPWFLVLVVGVIAIGIGFATFKLKKSK